MENQKEVEPTFDFFSIPPHILDDLCCRFIINVPAQEKKDLVRICFQIEQAHWFYLDFYSIKFNDTLRPCNLKEFARNIFYHIRYLRPFVKDLDLIIDDWKEYKYSVPTFGAIIVDEDFSQVLLVKSYWSKSSWGFPKGKINKDETPCHCAAREVYEEIGFNISPLIHPDVYIETIINEQCIRLYIVSGVDRSTKFTPQTRNEIKDIRWFPIEDIPIKKTKVKNKLNGRFYMVMPFMRDLRKWILQNGHPKLGKQRRSFKSFSEVEDLIRMTSVEDDKNIQEIDSSNITIGKQPVEGNSNVDPENEVECYEGSDEDDVKQSNEEIYGIPKVKSFISGRDLDSYLLTCSDVSYMKKERIKNNLETTVTSPHEKELTSCSIVSNKSQINAKINLADKFVNNIEKNMLSPVPSKNLNVEKQNNAKNASYNMNTCLNNTKLKDNAQNKFTKSPYLNEGKAINKNNYRISNLLNSSKTLKYVDVNIGTQGKQIDSSNCVFSKNEFVKRLLQNKAIQAMNHFKFNKEALLKALE